MIMSPLNLGRHLNGFGRSKSQNGGVPVGTCAEAAEPALATGCQRRTGHLVSSCLTPTPISPPLLSASPNLLECQRELVTR